MWVRKGCKMETQDNNKARNRDTKNLSELLEFDFNDVKENSQTGALQADSGSDHSPAEGEEANGAGSSDSYLESFFEEDDMGLAASSDAGSGAGMSAVFESVKIEEEKKEEPERAKTAPAKSAQKTAAKRPVFRFTRTKGKTVVSNAYDHDVPEQGRAIKIVSGILVWAKDILLALLIAWLVITFIAQNCTVEGLSMQPTLMNSDRVLINKFIYRISEPQRGDIIVFKWLNPDTDKEEFLIKRVIGLPGDTIELLNGNVYVNEAVYDESAYLDVKTIKTGDMDGEVIVPDGAYFVMGDNRGNSKDSRYKVVGMVQRSQIVGKAAFRIWPLKDFKFIT